MGAAPPPKRLTFRQVSFSNVVSLVGPLLGDAFPDDDAFDGESVVAGMAGVALSHDENVFFWGSATY